MNTSAVIEWYDDVNPDSFVICLDHYGVKVLQAKPIDSAKTEIVIYGLIENVHKFVEDFNEDVLEPLDTMQSGDYDDEDYEAYLNNEVNYWLDLHDYAIAEEA